MMLDASPKPPARPPGDAPQAVALGLRFVSVQGGVAVGELPYREDLIGDPTTGVLAGGPVTTLLDHICGSAVFSALAEARPRRQVGSIATLDLRIDYMRGATPGLTVTARAHCYKLTRSIAFVRAVAFDADEADPVATVQAAFAINPPRTTGAEAP